MPQKNRLALPSAPAKLQIERRHLWNEERSSLSADFFTLGYTGRKIEEILGQLTSHNVRTLIDIRQYAVSMYRPELSKGNLQKRIENEGMAYFHLPELGVPRDIRAKALETGSRDVIWSWYDEHVVKPYLGVSLHRFLNCVEHPVAMMCVEIDPGECHRHRLFVRLEEMGLRGFDL